MEGEKSVLGAAGDLVCFHAEDLRDSQYHGLATEVQVPRKTGAAGKTNVEPFMAVSKPGK